MTENTNLSLQLLLLNDLLHNKIIDKTFMMKRFRNSRTSKEKQAA